MAIVNLWLLFFVLILEQVALGSLYFSPISFFGFILLMELPWHVFPITLGGMPWCSYLVMLASMHTSVYYAMLSMNCRAKTNSHLSLLQLLGTLVDSHSQIRSRSFNVLGSVKLSDLKVSKLTVQSLLGSLDLYPKVALSCLILLAI